MDKIQKPSDILRVINKHATRIDTLTADGRWLDAHLKEMGDCSLVLLGEATHGTHDFYRMRCEISKRLISEKGFNAVALEADWPDAHRVNQYVHGFSEDADSELALSGFKRFPTWMWRNADILDFVGWLRAYNETITDGQLKTGFYGLDLYSLYRSMDLVIDSLQKIDALAAQKARERYACFEHFNRDSFLYSRLAGGGFSENCESEVIAQLNEVQKKVSKTSKFRDPNNESEIFDLLQNARVIKNAEKYYRTMLQGHVASWNLRDEHMFETLESLFTHLQSRVPTPKIVVWAHNSHLGDARATQMSEMGELNLGQLVRRRFGEDSFLLGFTTYSGTVTAASEWNSIAERKSVRQAHPDSYEALFHQTGIPRFILNFRGDDFLKHLLKKPRLERAIGVIYQPQNERASHYFHARLADQFDAVFHLDETRAVEPLEQTALWKTGEAPETYPSAM